MQAERLHPFHVADAMRLAVAGEVFAFANPIGLLAVSLP